MHVSKVSTICCLYSMKHALVAESLEPNIYTADNKDGELRLLDVMLESSPSAYL